VTTLSITITYPSGGNVSGDGTFESYGTYSVSPTMSVAMSAWISNPNTGATIATGTAQNPPANCNWCFKFDSCPINETLTENVQGIAADGTTTTEQLDITCTSP
jgi:hypothetical protein